MAKEALFVYGTLQPGGPNEHLLAGVPGEWQRATIRGRLESLGWGTELGYPALILDPHGEEVGGFVLRSSDLSSHWSTLDQFEGKQYQRVISQVTLATGETIQAQVYVLKQQ